MKIFNKTISAILIAVFLLLPASFGIVGAIALPDPFEKSFVGALDEKYDKLYSAEGEKIVIVGGSSVAFGVRSDIIEEYTDMPVVNFGLYAALGTKLMLDLSLGAIGEGDIVIVTPELDKQTMSLYFNTDMTLKAMGGRFDMLLSLPMDNKLSLLSGMWNYAADKMEYYLKSLPHPDPDGVYNSKNFNEYGDLVYPREENVMLNYRDASTLINPSPEIVSDDFIEYLNDYAAACKRRGATVFFNFCPMNELGFAEGVGLDELLSLRKYFRDELDFDILGSPERSVLGAGYFYDTNFHLGDAGAVKYTAGLVEDLLFALDDAREVNIEIPPEPPLPAFDSYIDVFDENEKYFTFTALQNGSYAISGLTELGREAKTLTIPIAYSSRKVTSISSGALVGMTATKLIIPETTTLRAIDDGAFTGCGTLTELWIYLPDDEYLLPPSSFDGVGIGFTVHIPPESNYPTGYAWGHRGLTFIFDAE